MRISDWSSDVCSSDLRDRCTRLHDLLGACVSACLPVLNNSLQATDVGKVWCTGTGVAPGIHDQDFMTMSEPLTLLAAGEPVRRSEKRRVGKEWGSTCRTRVLPDHEKKKQKIKK